MTYSERAFTGPDITGQTFAAEPVAHCAAMHEHQRHARIERQAARRGRHRWNEEPPARECEPCFTLDRQIASARAEMGEARWAQLQAEWGETQ